MQNKMAPPATMKSPTDIPSIENSHFPTRIKTRARDIAVHKDWNMAFFLSFALNLFVKEINNGSTPMASTATKTGIKASNMFFIM
jgi:hypothetical protein